MNQSAENDAPFRVCCGQQHFGPVCPDGLVMCPLCFRRNPKERLHVLEADDGADVNSAPIYSDVCQTCHKREERWGARVIPPLRPTPSPDLPHDNRVETARRCLKGQQS